MKTCLTVLNKVGVQVREQLADQMVHIAHIEVIDPVFEETNIEDMFKQMDKYAAAGENEDSRVLTNTRQGILPYTQCREIIEKVKTKTKTEMRELDATRKDDIEQMKVRRLFGQWKHQGASKSLFRKCEEFTAKFKWINKVEPMEFLQVIVQKAQTPSYLKVLA